MLQRIQTFWWVVIGVFFLLGFTIYGASLGNSFVRWDDGLLIYENPAIRGLTFSNLKTIFTTYDPELYIPLTLLSYQFDFLIGGISPTIYHLHSLILHIFNGILVVYVCSKLTSRKWIGFVAGVLFFIHPLNTEAVAWASGRKDLLSTFFFLLTLIWYESFSVSSKQSRYILSVCSFILGLLAKVTILTAPAVLVLIHMLKKRKFSKQFVISMIPFLIASLVFAVIAFYGKTGVLDSSTRIEKMLIAPFSTVFYLQKFLLPTGLSVIYPFTGTVELLSARILIPIVICVLIIGISFYSLKRTRWILFCFGFFFITLSPSLLNFSKGDFLYFASDRYAYIPSIGLCLLGALLLRVVWEYSHKLSTIVLSIIFLVFSTLAIAQSLVWKTSESLFTHTIEHYPEAHSAHNNLGNIYRTRGEVASAIASYQEALRLSEEFGRGNSALFGRSKILSNLTSAYRSEGNIDLALETVAEATRLNELNQHAHMQEGIIFGMQGKVDEAEKAYQTAINLDETFTTAKINLGSLYINTNRPELAVDILEDAVSWNPYYPQAFYNLAAAYKQVSRMRESMESYEKAVELEPAFIAARINLGIAYADRRWIEKAKEQFKAVLVYDPDNQRALSALSQLNAL